MARIPVSKQRRKPTGVRKSEIVDAAMRIIASEGIRRFTAKIVAQGVGVTDGALFRHFPSMEAIEDAIIDRMEFLLFSDFPPESPDPLKRVAAFYQARVATILKHPHLSRLLLSDHVARLAGAERAARIDGFKQRSHEFVYEHLLEAKRKKLLAKGVSPETGTILVLGAIMALVHEGTTPESPAKIERQSREVWAVVERVLHSQGRGR